VTLEPDPIPLDIKIVLVGDRMLYYLLHELDNEFSELFKVVADFDDNISMNPENTLLYARFIATLARRENLLHFNKAAVARILQYSMRISDDSEKLSTHMRNIFDLLREADYWAKQNTHTLIGANDVQKAIDHQIARNSRLKEETYEEILRNTLLIDTEGSQIGQINGLSVISMGDFAFALPTRVTATAHLGEGHVIDIEREVELGGPIHSKGVLILSSFIGGRYAKNHPLSLSASVVFEQSYGMVEGDSASLAELCVLLSAIAQVPIKQSLGITGSINQHGQVQAIGGVNEKIEGFFDICNKRGLTGQQGVIIPADNIKHLMLRDDIVEAARNDQINIYPIRTVDEALELLTGMPAGARDEQGNFPEGSLNAIIEAKLVEMANIKHTFSEQFKEKEGVTEA
jgi:lon-related putative ATP-dependent protease